jgi:hypothetical protein
MFSSGDASTTPDYTMDVGGDPGGSLLRFSLATWVDVQRIHPFFLANGRTVPAGR